MSQLQDSRVTIVNAVVVGNVVSRLRPHTQAQLPSELGEGAALRRSQRPIPPGNYAYVHDRKRSAWNLTSSTKNTK